ncbi:MAG: universal stress protein [Deltaproteobacteria bacterium]|nr:universal stress protein [Deltaproteobacteria bacterium]MBW2447010.1 universal stress protein [Deltaproteobacteria bacterium]
MSVRIQRILVPLDFSEHAAAILEWAAHLAEEHGSTLILMHAYHLPVEFQQMEGAYLPAEFWTQVKTEAEKALEGHAAKLRPRGITVETEVTEGYPATAIEEEAIRQKADLIVIGTHGHTGLKHLLLGSVAQRVVQKSPCPVLTVKTPEAEDEAKE